MFPTLDNLVARSGIRASGWGRAGAVLNLTCEAAILRGRLKHSWLENQVLNKNGADVLRMRVEGPWNALVEQFPARIGEAQGLAEGMIEAFSPAKLIDKIERFASLSEKTKEVLREAVHSIYLARKGLDEQQQSLARATAQLANMLDRVRKLWRDGSERDLERAWQDVISAATVLRDQLEALPKGIVLP